MFNIWLPLKRSPLLQLIRIFLFGLSPFFTKSLSQTSHSRVDSAYVTWRYVATVTSQHTAAPSIESLIRRSYISLIFILKPHNISHLIEFVYSINKIKYRRRNSYSTIHVKLTDMKFGCDMQNKHHQ